MGVVYSDEDKLTKSPDLRPVLYWNPSIVVGENKRIEIEFYTSDQSGEFDVVVEGSSGNVLGRAKTSIRVEN